MLNLQFDHRRSTVDSRQSGRGEIVNRTSHVTRPALRQS